MARPKTFDDDTVLDAALLLFWERGYDGVSVGDLEERLGIGRQSLYNVFGDKRALFHRALARYVDAGARQRHRLLVAERGLSGIRAYFMDVIRFMTDEAGARGCFLVSSGLREGESDPQVALHCRANDEALHLAFRAALAVARERGEVPRDIPLDDVARMLLVHRDGMAVQAAGGATRAELEGATRWLVDRLA